MTGIKVAAALLGVEIAKRKPVWEKSPSAPECEMRAKNNQALLEQISTKECGRSSMAERQLPKLHTRVRFPSPAPSLATDRPER
jgi:hypothetical protein